MSLLMDALRRAEQQKQNGAASASAPADTGAGGGNLSLEPLTDPGPPSRLPPEPVAVEENLDRRLPELPKRLEELDDQFFTADPVLQKSIRALAETKARAAEPPPPPVNAPADNARAAAQNVFAVKQAAPTIGHGFAITVGVATLMASAAIGGYFYWQMQPRGGLVAGPGLAAPQHPVAPLPGPVVQDPSPAPAVVAAMPEMAAPAPPPARAAPPTRPAVDPAPPQGAPKRVAALPDEGIRFSSGQKTAGTTMETAHAAFMRGETDLARSIWMKTFQTDARNINALHGLAAIAQLEGRPDQAAILYRRVLEVDPKDAVAHAGLLAISAPADLRQAESQLKGLLTEQPNSPHLHFALGNLYLNDARWAEAQQAFFKAHVADPANPDYLYNLAVSLDHLHQTKLAAQHYARALAAARSQAAAFDPAQAEARIKVLQAERIQ